MTDIRLAIDFGYGDVKYTVEIDGKKIEGKFPSVLKKADDNVEDLENKFNTTTNYRVVLDGKNYFVGHQAVHEGGEREWVKDIYKNTNYRKLIDASIAIALNKEGISPKNVKVKALVLAIPLTPFSKLSDGERLKIQDLFRDKSEVELRETKFTLFYQEQNVKVGAQGHMASVYIDHKYKEQNGRNLSGNIYFVDIGYNTWDEFLLKSSNQGLQIVFSSIKTQRDVGVRSFYQTVAKTLMSELDENSITVSAVEDAIKNKVYTKRGNDYTEIFFEVLKEAEKQYVEMYVARIRQSLGEDQINSLSAIYIIGGGGEMFDGRILEKLKFGSLVGKEEDLSFLNVKGCSLLAQSIA